MTGQELLLSLQKQLKEVQDSVKLIEANIKMLNNRVGKLLSGDDQMQAKPVAEISAAPPIRAAIPKQQDVFSEETTEKPGTLVYKKVFGKLKNGGSEPLEGVLIKVFDKNNEVCATTESDAVGYWETMLRPGRYVAEYSKTGLKTVNKTFEFGVKAKEYEVK